MKWKKVYEKYIQLAEEGKLEEQVFWSRVIFSVLLIVMCLGFMGGSAYAYFTTGVSFGTSTIQSGKFDLNVRVESATILPNQEGYFVFENISGENNTDVEDRTYEMVLSVTDDTTATAGYAKIEVLTDVNLDGSRQMYYTTPIGEGVENEEYRIQLLVPANKTVKVKITPEWGTCARETTLAEGTKVVPDFVDSKFVHVSFDDVTNSLANLSNKDYATLYDEPFFAWLKSLHDAYGAKFSIYTYVNILEHVPDTYQADFAEAKDWLRIGLHAEDATSSYAGLDYNTGKMVWKRFADNVYRITGTYESVDRMPKLEKSAGSKEVLLGMRDAYVGTEIICSPLGFIADVNDDETYYLEEEQKIKLFEDDFYIVRENEEPQFVFVATDLQFGKLSEDEEQRQKEYEAATALQSCIVFAHEGQFYNEGGFIQDEDGDTELLKKQVEELCKYAVAQEIQFKYPQTRDFVAIEEIKVALEKAAQEKANAEKVDVGQNTGENATEEKDTSSKEQTKQESTLQNDGE